MSGEFCGPLYGSLPDFVGNYLAQVYRRSVDGRNRTWCPHWWAHPEAVARLGALWRGFEALQADPDTGVSVWFRDHADHHMAVLFDPDGPFRGCSPEKGHQERLAPLPVGDPPPGVAF